MSPLCIVVLSSAGPRTYHSETARVGSRYHEPYRPELYALARAYTVPAPGGHSWPAWAGALGILATVAVVLGRAL